MTASQHRHGAGAGGSGAEPALVVAAVAMAAAGVAELALHAADALQGAGAATWNPLVLLIDVARGRVRWPTLATVLAAVLVVLLVVVAVALSRRRTGPRHPDRAARLMATGRDLQPVTHRAMRRKARDRFGLQTPGLPVARAVVGGQVIYADWEAEQIEVAGPRRQKTSARAIPTLLAAPGAAFATSNKPDLYASTRLIRERGGRVWNLDPQGLAGGQPDWWWNPLSYVTSVTRAQELTDAFVGAYTDPSTRTDAYFEPEGHNLVSNLLLAAALDGRPVTDAYRWTLDPNQMLVPAGVLRDRGQELAGASLDSQANLPGDQRGGVFGTAKKILGFLENPDVCRWIVGSRSDARPQLDLAAFVQSTDTLYLHSKEGKGSSAGVVTALAMALCDAAETYAKRSPGGRLRVPLVGVLDEAANICRWRQLPNLYSHYGSRGVCLLTLLQGWSQGVEVWGEAGMEKLWTSANVKSYGGGSDEDRYLARLERLVGDYDRVTVSVSDRRDGRSTSRQSTRTAILPVADLRALPCDRLIVFASGTAPAWARPLYWWEGSAAADIRESLRRFDPAAAEGGT